MLGDTHYERCIAKLFIIYNVISSACIEANQTMDITKNTASINDKVQTNWKWMIIDALGVA